MNKLKYRSGKDNSDPYGNRFPSILEKCNFYGVTMDLYRNRGKKGFSEAQKLGISPILKKGVNVFHVERYDLTIKRITKEGDVFKCYFNEGQSDEEFNIMDYPMIEKYCLEKYKPEANSRYKRIESKYWVYDHLGNVFSSLSQMLDAYDVTDKMYYQGKERGLSLEDILTNPNMKKTYHKTRFKQIDHLGNHFNSFEEMANFHKRDPMTLKHRIKSGLTLEEALTIPEGKRGKKYTIKTDPYGNEFYDLSELLFHYNIPIDYYYKYNKKGLSLKEIIERHQNNIKCHGANIIDPFGRKFLSITALCEAYNQKYQVYWQRIRAGYNQIVALGISPLIRERYNGYIGNFIKTNYDLTITKRIKKGMDVFECFINIGQSDEKFRIMSYDMINDYCLNKYKEKHGII